MKRRILVADDASFMRQMIREIIEMEDYEVVAEAIDGIQAMELYQEHRPDLVTMDIGRLWRIFAQDHIHSPSR